MATTPVRMLLPPGLGTLTLRLYPIDGDEADHESSVAESSVPGRWTWSVTEALAGDYEAVVSNADNAIVAGGRVRLTDTEGLHWVDAAASQASVDGIPKYGDVQRWTNTSTTESHDITVEEVT